MAGLHKSDFTNPVINWIDTRLPIFTMMQQGIRGLPDAEELQLLLEFRRAGDRSTLVIMIVTGIFLAMNYTPNTDMAFDSRRSTSCAT